MANPDLGPLFRRLSEQQKDLQDTLFDVEDDEAVIPASQSRKQRQQQQRQRPQGHMHMAHGNGKGDLKKYGAAFGVVVFAIAVGLIVFKLDSWFIDWRGQPSFLYGGDRQAYVPRRASRYEPYEREFRGSWTR